MFDNPIYNFPIEKILEAFQAVKGRCPGMYFSPLRTEKTPSFHVDYVKNLWYDHGLGTGGTNVQLVQLFNHCTQREAEEFIRSLAATVFPGAPAAQPSPTKPNIEIVSIKDIQMPFLIEYITGRGIPISIAKRYCCEIMMTNRSNGRHYFVVGFLNNSEGFAMKSPYGYKSTTKAGITTIDSHGQRSLQPSSGAVYVFEGFFDFLSLLAIQETEMLDADVVILNSINNLHRAIPYFQHHSRIDGKNARA